MIDASVSAARADLSVRPRRMRERIRAAFDAEEQEGLELAVKGRSLALIAIALLLFIVNPLPDVLYYHALIAVFLLLGLLNAWLSRSRFRQAWHGYAFATIDFALLSFVLLYPNPFAGISYPPQLSLRFGNFVYFFVLLCGLAFSYRPRLMLIGGLAGTAMWVLGVLLIIALPETKIDISGDLSPDQIIRAMLQPTFVVAGAHIQQAVVFLIVAGLLAAVVARSRRLVIRQAVSERERGNLARYFPPSMVDRLARMDAPLSQVREHDAAVLFADIVGFTRFSETHRPTEVIAFLRQVHERLETAVFENGGTLDKFIGDGVMATFGTPEAGPDDAGNALRCLQAILNSFDTWNALRSEQGKAPVHIAVGLHYGPVVSGDIGSERRLEFAVLGDTVNVASRLERLTRSVGCRAIVSDAVVDTARQGASGGAAQELLDGLKKGAAVEIPGRQRAVAIWTI